MQNLESDNILDWLVQVSGQAGRVGWYDCKIITSKLGGLLNHSTPPPLTHTHSYYILCQVTSHNSISIAGP